MGTSRDGVEPTVLLVGAGERFTPAFQAALSRYRVQVETTELGAVVDAVIVTAPDLVLLMGEAAKDGGATVLQKLANLSQNFTVPVVVLNDDSELDAKLSAFRHGASAVLPHSASVDATAERVAKMAHDLPEQGSAAQGGLGDATLDEFIGALSRQLRSGLVSSLAAGTADSADLKLTLGRGRPLTDFLDTFVRSVRRHVVRAEPLRYELGDATPNEALGPSRTSLAPGKPEVAALRVVLADDDTPRSDAVAQELRARGVTVVITDLDPSPTRFQTLRQADPTVFLIGEDHAHGPGYDLLRRIRRDSRLRWASLLVVRWDEIWSEERGAPSLARLESTLAGLLEHERALFARAEARTPFDTRLETTGPARCLRALERSALPLRVRVENPRVELTLDLSDGLIVGAEGRTLELEPRQLSGVSALSALLVLGSGRVRIEPVESPASANIMTPVEAALTMADAETPPISPSVPAAGTVSLHPPAPVESPAGPVGSVRPTPIVQVSAAAPPRPRAAVPPPSLGAPRPRGASALPAPALPAPVLAPVPVLAPAPVHVPAALPLAATIAAPVFETSPPASTSELGPPSSAPHERNPPAMTLPTPVVAEASAASGLGAPVALGWRMHGRAFAAWFAQQDAKLHGKRIPFRTTAVLVGLGALQGLLIVVLWAGARWVTRPRLTLEQGAAAHAERVGKSVAPEPPGALTPSAERPPAPSAAAPAATAALALKSPVSVVPVDAGQADGSGHDAPDCAVLLAADPPRPGFYPGAALQQMRKGRVAIVHGDLNAAQAALCRAAVWNADSAEVALELALVLLLERDGPSAAEWARRAVDLAPKNSGAQDALGDALARLGDTAGARRAFIAAARLEPSNEAGIRALLTRAMKLADHALRHGDLITAERAFRRAGVLEPKSSSAASGLSYALIQMGDVVPGVLWARRAVELAPRSSGARLVLGDALAKSGDKTSAASEWREATLLDPANREAQKRLRAAGLPPT